MAIGCLGSSLFRWPERRTWTIRHFGVRETGTGVVRDGTAEETRVASSLYTTVDGSKSVNAA